MGGKSVSAPKCTATSSDIPRVCYLAPTVPLVKQQAAFINSQLGNMLRTKSYTGDDMVDLWDETQWLKEFNSQDVLVMTRTCIWCH